MLGIGNAAKPEIGEARSARIAVAALAGDAPLQRIPRPTPYGMTNLLAGVRGMLAALRPPADERIGAPLPDAAHQIARPGGTAVLGEHADRNRASGAYTAHPASALTPGGAPGIRAAIAAGGGSFPFGFRGQPRSDETRIRLGLVVADPDHGVIGDEIGLPVELAPKTRRGDVVRGAPRPAVVSPKGSLAVATGL